MKKARKFQFWQYGTFKLCSKDERRSSEFGTTWGWAINDRFFIFEWTIPLNTDADFFHWRMVLPAFDNKYGNFGSKWPFWWFWKKWGFQTHKPKGMRSLNERCGILSLQTLKGLLHPKNESSIIYSPSCHFKTKKDFCSSSIHKWSFEWNLRDSVPPLKIHSTEMLQKKIMKKS